MDGLGIGGMFDGLVQQQQCICVEDQGQIAYVLAIAVVSQYIHILRRVPLQPAANFHYVAPVDKLIVAKQAADGGCDVRDMWQGKDICQR